MAQNSVNYADNPTGPQLLDNYLAKEQENILSSNSGIQRPSYAVAGTAWLDTSVTPWLYKIYDGSNDATIGAINPTTHAFIAQGVDETDLVHKSDTETIIGTKTFSSSPIIPTATSGDNSTKAASTAFVANIATGLVHKSGSEDINGDKTFYNVIKSKNSGYTGTHVGYYYMQSGGSLILGLRSGSSWTNYIQWKLDGTLSVSGTCTIDVPTQATSNNSTSAASTAFVKSLFVQGEPPVNADSNVFYYTLEEEDEEE